MTTNLTDSLHKDDIRKAARVLNRAAKLLEDPGKWTKNMFARRANGKKVQAHSFKEFQQQATCFCTAGAIAAVQGKVPEAVRFYSDPAFRYADFVMADVPAANDRRSTTHMQVLNALDIARLLAKDDLKSV